MYIYRSKDLTFDKYHSVFFWNNKQFVIKFYFSLKVMLLISNIVFEGLGLGSRQTHYFDKLKKLLFFKILVWVGSGGVVTTKIIHLFYSICCIFVGGGARDGLWILYFLKYNKQLQVEDQDKKLPVSLYF